MPTSYKDEHILIIAPGSQTTLAQLGLPESFSPARLRVSTRMFPAENKDEWEPIKVRERRVSKRHSDGEGNGNIAMDSQQNGDTQPNAEDYGEEILYEEDPTTEEGAVFPLEDGRIVNWSCFCALLHHIYNTLSPPFHTPILVISQPAWTAQDKEKLTRFIFEQLQIPAFTMMDSAVAVCYAYGVSTATVIDVGYGKCDVTAVHEFLAYDLGRGIAVAGCGGDAMTQRLLKLLSSKGFTKDMCEQLKQSSVCEILPPGTALPGEAQTDGGITNPAAAASTGASGSGSGQRGSIAAHSGIPRGPGVDTIVGDEDQDREFRDGEDKEGVLDVASIVASGKTSEFLARKEREKAEKAEKAAARKAANDAAAAPKQARLPNAKREKAIFHYSERRNLEEIDSNGKRTGDGDERDPSGAKRQRTPEPAEQDANTTAAQKENRTRSKEGTTLVRRDVEVGIERFQAASGGILDQVADTIHRCILSVPEVSKRSELWDSLVILGNGSKVKGFKDALLATLNSKYLISPSSATIFTSELPSNFSTPMPTGANTPQPQSHHPQSGVNPLLLAATTASNHLAPPQQGMPSLQQYQTLYAQHQMHSQSQHSHHAQQTPTSIKTVKVPEYFPEWKDVGMEEAAFLGAQVAAKVLFVVDQSGPAGKGYLKREEYNDVGPGGIFEFCL